MDLDNFSSDVLVIIFQYLAPSELIQVARVNSQWRALAYHSSLWREHCQIQWKLPNVCNNTGNGKTWKEIYESKHSIYNIYKSSIDHLYNEFLSAIATNIPGEIEDDRLIKWRTHTHELYAQHSLTVQTAVYPCPRTEGEPKDVYSLKLIGIVPVPLDHVLDILVNFELRDRWDPEVRSATTIKPLNYNTEITKIKYKSLSMLCTRQVIKSSDKKTVYIITGSLDRHLLDEDPDLTFDDKLLEYTDTRKRKVEGMVQEENENFTGVVKRGSGFVLRFVDQEHTEILYLSQLLEGQYVDKNVLNWMCSDRWNTLVLIQDYYFKEYQKMLPVAEPGSQNKKQKTITSGALNSVPSDTNTNTDTTTNTNTNTNTTLTLDNT